MIYTLKYLSGLWTAFHLRHLAFITGQSSSLLKYTGPRVCKPMTEDQTSGCYWIDNLTHVMTEIPNQIVKWHITVLQTIVHK
jgi:hypothetical protein